MRGCVVVSRPVHALYVVGILCRRSFLLCRTKTEVTVVIQTTTAPSYQTHEKHAIMKNIMIYRT